MNQKYFFGFGLTHSGPLTWVRLSQECAAGSDNIMPPYPGSAIRVGARGESVQQLQRCLNRVGTRHSSIQQLTEDGIFGPRTLDAVTTFQRIFGLIPDGVVGPLTWMALTRECGTAATIRAAVNTPSSFTNTTSDMMKLLLLTYVASK